MSKVITKVKNMLKMEANFLEDYEVISDEIVNDSNHNTNKNTVDKQAELQAIRERMDLVNQQQSLSDEREALNQANVEFEEEYEMIDFEERSNAELLNERLVFEAVESENRATDYKAVEKSVEIAKLRSENKWLYEIVKKSEITAKTNLLAKQRIAVEYKELKMENASKASHITYSEEKLIQMGEREATLKLENDKLDQVVSQLKYTVEELEGQIKNVLNVKIDNLVDQNNDLVAKNNDLIVQNVKLKDQIEELIHVNKTLTLKNKELQLDIKDLHLDIQELELGNRRMDLYK